MKVRDFCNRDVVTIGPLAGIREASIAMRNRHVGALVVVEPGGDGERPVGILTDRDILMAVLAVPGAHADDMRVCDAMSAPLALAKEEEGASEAAATMSSCGVRRLPVVDRDGVLRGILSADDVQRVLCAEMASLAAALKKGAQRERIEHRVLDALARRA